MFSMNIISASFMLIFIGILASCMPDKVSTSSYLPNVGSAHTETVQVGRAMIPLPEGQWTVMASGITANNLLDGGQAGGTANAILGRLLPAGTGSAIDAFIQVRANVDNQRIIWSRDPSCARTDWLYVEDRYAQERDQTCVYVRAWNTNFQYTDSWSKVERDFVDWARANRVQLGQKTFLGTHYRIVRGSDITRIWYYFSNSALGVSTSENQWHAVARQNRPEFERAFRSQIDWTREWEQKVVAGALQQLALPNRQPVTSSPPPSPIVGQDPSVRLRDLESLRSQGLINQQEFDSRRQRILDGL
jgi:hypothetical protein